jgi:hypothetical protein
MKIIKIICVTLFVLFWISASEVSAQAPEGINYQAVFRNSAGVVIPDQELYCQIDILQGNDTGPVIYSERHEPTTNHLGIVNFIIGEGGPIQGVFSDIDWGNGPYYLKLYVDYDAQGSVFQMSQYGVQMLVSVPYALHAKVADSIAGGGSGSGTNGQDGEDGQDGADGAQG